jgi:hypothetical protein
MHFLTIASAVPRGCTGNSQGDKVRFQRSGRAQRRRKSGAPGPSPRRKLRKVARKLSEWLEMCLWLVVFVGFHELRDVQPQVPEFLAQGLPGDP